MVNKKDNGIKSSKSISKTVLKQTPSLKQKIPKNILQFEKLISGFSATLIDTPEESLESELNSWLKKFVEFLKVDRCIVSEYTDDRKTIRVLMSYIVPEVDSIVIVYEHMPRKGVIEEIEKGEIIRVEKIPDDLPEPFRGGPVERDKTKSVVFIPLSIGNKVIGSLSFASYRRKRKWPDEVVRRTKLVGEIIANAILRIRSHKSLLDEMSRRENLENRYSTILKNANVGFIISDFYQNILEVNDEYCRMSGYSHDEILVKKLWELDASLATDKIGKDGADDRRQIQKSHIRKDGTLFDVELNENIFEEEGITCTFVRDITDLNKAREQLEERLEFEELVSEFSNALMNRKSDDIGGELTLLIKKFVDFFKVDRGVIVEYMRNPSIAKILMSYTVGDLKIKTLEESYNISDSLMNEYEKGLIIRAERLNEDLPEEIREWAQSENIKSFIIIPLTYAKQVIGNITLASHRKNRSWPDDLVKRIKLIGEIIANAILRMRSQESLIEEVERRKILEDRYSSILKNASVGFLISDLEQNIIEVNDEYCRMSGYSHDEILAKKLWELDASLDTDKVRKDGEDDERHIKTSHIRKDGTIFDVELSGNFFKEDGIVCSFIRDITDLNKAREQLEERLKFEKLVSEFSAALITPADVESELNSWLKKFVEFMDVERGIVIEYLDDLRTVQVIMQYAVPEVGISPLGSTYTIPEGEIEEFQRGMFVRAEKIPDDLPELLRGGFIEADNTRSVLIVPLSVGSRIIGNLTFANYRKERKWSDDIVRRIKLIGEIIANAILRNRSREALIEEVKRRKMLEDKYSSILKNASVGFMITDLSDFSVIDVNDEYCRMSGYDRDELISKKIWVFDAAQNPDKVRQDKISMMEQEGVIHLETSHIRKDGSLFDIEISSNVFEEDNIVCTFIRDVTEIKKAQKEQAERLRFEELVSEFSAALINIEPDEINDELERWIIKIVELLDVDRGIVHEYINEQKTTKVLMHYTVPEIDLSTENMRSTPDGLVNDLEGGGIIRAEKIPEDLPQSLRDGVVEKHGTKSLVVVPLLTGNKVFGNLSLASYRKERSWPDDLIRRIKLLGEIIGNAVLRMHSYEDLLKETEQRKEIEERYTTIIKTANVGFWISDPDLNILTVNDEYCRMSGYSREELLGKKIWQIDAAGHPDKIKKERTILHRNGSIHHVTSHRKKDGTLIDIDVSTKVFDKEGNVCSFMRDITDLNRARKDLEERLEFEELVTEFSAALINIRPDDIYREVNKWLKTFVGFLGIARGVVSEYLEDENRVEVLMQYTVPEIDAAPLERSNIVDKEIMNEFRKGLILKAEKIPDDLPPVFRKTFKAKSLIIVPLLTGNNAFGHLSFADYISERRWPDELIKRVKLVAEIIANAIDRVRSHEKLIEEMEQRKLIEERYSQILGSANVGFWISDFDTNILDVNDEYCTMSGYSREELLSMKIIDIAVPMTSEAETVFTEEITRNSSAHHEATHIKRDGSLMDLDVSSAVFEERKIFFSFMRDITEEKQAKVEREERLGFEELVSEFSAALMNIELGELIEELNKWIIKFVDFLEIGRGIINEYDYDNNIMKALVNYTDPAVVDETSPHDKDLKVPFSIMDEFRKGAMIRAEKIPDDLPERLRGWIIERHNTRSLAVVPLTSESKIIGNITFASYRKERKWSDDIFSRIKLVGEIIASAILRMRAHEALTRAQQELAERFEFEKVISEFSTALININPDDIIKELGRWLEKFVEIMDVDRFGVNEYSYDHYTIKNLIQYSVPGISVPIPDIRKTPQGEITELEKGLIRAEKIPEDLPRIFNGSHIENSMAKSLVIVPLYTGNRIFGNLAFSNYRRERKWSDEFVRRIKLIAEIVGNAIQRLRSHDALLEEMDRRHMLEERYSSIVKTANVGFMISDMDASILEVNDAYCEMSGYSRDELLGMKIYQLDISGNQDKVDKDKAGIFEAGSFHHETCHIRKDGTVMNILISANLLKKEGVIFSFIRDVTELKIAREDLEDRLRFEELTAEFSAALINLKLENIDEELTPWLKKYIEFLEVERGIINEYQYEKNKINVIAIYTGPDVNIPAPGKILEVPESIMEKLKEGAVVRAENVPEDLPPVFNEGIIKSHDVKSIVIVPLSAENQIMGDLTFITYTKEHKWSDELLRRVRLIGEIIANAILRKHSSDALIAEMEQRRRLEERYTSIIKNANVGFMISDLNQNIMVVNDEYCRMSGYSREELNKMRISDIDFSEDPDKVNVDAVKTIDVGFFYHQSRHIHKSGRVYDVEVNSKFLESEDIVFSFIRDVTELNKARRELEERLKFEEIVSEFSAALINVKIASIKDELNIWLERLALFLNVDKYALGEYEDDYRQYRFISTYINPDLDPRPREFSSIPIRPYGFTEFLKKGEIIVLENIDKDGARFSEPLRQKLKEDGTKSILMYPLVAGDTLLGSMLISSITTERTWPRHLIRELKLVAEIFANALMRDRRDLELDNYRKDLEIMVDERTAELKEAQKELVINEKMATLGRLTATVSHELRNPLGTIRSSVFSIQRRLKEKDKKVETALERAERNIKRCDLIIDELLNYSRVQGLNLTPTPIDEWLSEALEETGPPEGISVKKELNSNEIINMDQERFRRSMVNILTNAYQSIQEKDAEELGYVIVTTRKDNGNLIIEVSDNGVGFEMDKKDKIFEPLYSTKTFGVGLGVPITKQIIEQHGWSMDMMGEPQKGASVIITIPLSAKI